MSDTIPQDDTPRKQCTKCHELLPATLAYFHKSRKGKFGLRGACKKCMGRESAFGKVWAEITHEKMMASEKQCTKCLQWYPKNTDYFYPNKTQKDGLYSHCKECSKEAKRASYNTANKEEHRQRSRQYYKSHKEEVCRNVRAYYALRKEEVLQYKKRYRQEHYEELHTPEMREQSRLRTQKWRWLPENVEHRRAMDRVTAHRRRARKRSISGSHTPQQLRELYTRQRGRCYYCRKKVKWGKHHVDHTFPISRVAGTDIPANDISYLVITCPSCNIRKQDKFPWEWVEGGRLL